MVDLVMIKLILVGSILVLVLYRLSLIISFDESILDNPSLTPLIYPLVVELMSYQDVYFWSGILYSFFLLIYPVVSLFNDAAESV